MYSIVVWILSCSVVIAFSLLWSVFVAVSHEITQIWEERVHDLEKEINQRTKKLNSVERKLEIEREQYNCERRLLREYLLEANCMLILAAKTPHSG